MKHSIIYILALVSGLVSCRKFVTLDPPETQIESVKIFTDNKAAVSAVTGLYSQMGLNAMMSTTGGVTLYAGLSADEIYNTAASAEYDAFVTNNLPVNNGTGLYGRLWKAPYQFIYQSNAVLEGLDRSTALTDSVKKQLRGEMLLVRALLYFYLVNLFGDVPLITTTDYRVAEKMPRIAPAEIYRQLKTDLEEAVGLLKEYYPSANRARPNKWTAMALLSRIYLYTKEWQKAEAASSAVINAGMYTLVNNAANVFVTSSGETIWQLVRDNNNTAEGATFLPSSGTAKPPFAITSYLLNAFEAGDQRKTAWIGKNTNANTDYYYPAKYKIRATTPVTEYYVIFRLAEQYLIRAEARANQNNIAGAQSDVNVIRNRALLPNTVAATQADILPAIEKERRIEFLVEWGHRWLDMKRTNRADAILTAVKSPNWQSTDVLYPIPLREMQSNPFLIQNPGY